MRTDPSSGERPVHHGSPVAAPGVPSRSGLVLTAATSAMVLLVLDSGIVGITLPGMRSDLHLSTTRRAPTGPGTPLERG
jgi:hypothetical protein